MILTDLVLWLKADVITGLSDGDPVGTWLDSSGHNNHVTQATAGSKPTYRASTASLNNKPTVEFDGVDDHLFRLTCVSLQQDNFTMVAVLKPSSTTTSTVPLSNGNNNGWGIASSTNTGKKGWIREFTSWDSTTTAADTNAQIHTVARASGTTTVYIDGTALSPTFPGTPPPPGVGVRGQATIVGVVELPPGVGGAFYAGQIAECLIWNHALTSGERAFVHGVLGAKYGISV